MAEPAGEVRVGIGPEGLEALRRRPSLIRILATIDSAGGALWTREVIRRVGSWTHTHRRLLELAALGLVRRRIGTANGRQAVWNELTPLGREVLSLLREEGHPTLEGVEVEVVAGG